MKLVHPKDDPNYKGQNSAPVWYMAHPLAPDDKMSYYANLEDVLKWMKFCFNYGFRVVAPYHTVCLVLDDSIQEHRTMGLEMDVKLVRQIGRIILTGHKISSGMEIELETIRSIYTPTLIQECVIDLTGLSAHDAASKLLRYKDGRL